MSHLYGVGLNIETQRITTHLKKQIQKKGGIGLRALAISLTRSDRSGSGSLDSDDFEAVLALYNIFPSKVQL